MNISRSLLCLSAIFGITTVAPASAALPENGSITIPGNVVSGAADRPNIVWLSCEDISSHLGCYGDPNATTPNLDAFAQQGVRYTQAFTCHGVCAPCRTGIITGMYPMAIGANHMRSKVTLPDHIKCFPYYLKQSGYYCTNNSKTDYNFHWKQNEVWNESSNKAHWKNRPQKDQPFFAVFNMTMTHESKIWPQGWKQVVKDVPQEKLHDPDKISVPRLYPDTPEVRAAHARLLDIIMVMDTKVGEYLKEIEDAGLADNTIVIYWSDHGNGFPRAKRWIYDSGTLVPMIARVPEHLRTDGQAAAGSVSDQLINLIDLGPTVLNLASIEVPQHMDGQPFLGSNLPEPREYIHGARDRIDERFDMVRSVRDKQFRYLRNLNSWWPALQHIEYAETSMVRKEMRRLKADGALHAESAQFLNDTRPTEELYDLKADPWELNNLAAEPGLTDTLNRLRDECDRWQLDVRDAHLIPEAILNEEEQIVGNRWQILHNGNDGLNRTQQLLSLAKVAGQPRPTDAAMLLRSIASKDAAERWWAVTGLGNLTTADAAIKQTIKAATDDMSTSVRIAAARALHKTGSSHHAIAVLSAALDDPSEFVQHAALIELDEMGAEAAPVIAKIKSHSNGKGYAGNVARHALKLLSN